MKKLPSYAKIGQKVKTIRPIYFQSSKEEIPAGTIGEINGIGLDAQFGWYSVKFGGNEIMFDLLANCEIVN